MIRYKEYLSALEAAFAEYTSLQTQKLTDLKTRFSIEERSITGRHKSRMSALNADTEKSLQNIRLSLSSTKTDMLSQETALNEELQILRQKDESVTSEHKDTARLADEKRSKREDIRSKLFKFWWD